MLRALVLLQVSALAVAASISCAGPTEPEHPHVIVISVDTLRADHLGCYGYDRPTSPRIDALAERGVRFSAASSQSSWTLPAHMSLMTSQYPHVHGVVRDGLRLAESGVTLAEVLSGEGYETAGFASWIYVSPLFGFDQGFDYYFHLVDRGRLKLASGGGAFDAARVTKAAISWLARERTKPFFLFVHYFDPHMDYAPPAPYDAMFDPDYEGPADGTYAWAKPAITALRPLPADVDPRDRRHMEALYDGEIRYVDDQIARLLEAVEAGVGLDECLIVFLGDHGEEFQDHGSMEGHGWTHYEEILHVPLILRLPGGRRGGSVIDVPVELIDVAPTILDRLGIALPAPFQGRSLARLWDGSEPDSLPPAVFAETDHYNIVKRSIRGRRYKLIHTADTGRNVFGIPIRAGYELYDLDRDPRERVDLYEATSPVARHLAARLQALVELSAGNRPERVELPEADVELLRSLGYAR